MSDVNIRKIGNREATWFLSILFISKILFADINKYVNNSGTSAYMQTAWCAVVALALFLITACFSRGDDIFSASKSAFGSVGLKIISTLISLILLINTGVMIRVYADIIASIVLPDYADFLIILLLVTGAAFAAFAGVGTVASYGYGAGGVIIGALALILALNIPNYDLYNIYPVLGMGADKIFLGFDGLTAYADVFLIYLMCVYFKEGTSLKKSGIKAIIIGGVVITTTTFAYVLTVPYPSSGGFTLPVLEIAFDVNLDVIFQRAEGVFLFIWIFSGFILISAYLTFALLSFEKGFNLSDRKAPIGAFLVIAASVAMCADTSSNQRDMYELFYKAFTLISFVLPFVVYGVKRLRKGKV